MVRKPGLNLIVDLFVEVGQFANTDEQLKLSCTLKARFHE